MIGVAAPGTVVTATDERSRGSRRHRVDQMAPCRVRALTSAAGWPGRVPEHTRREDRERRDLPARYLEDGKHSHRRSRHHLAQGARLRSRGGHNSRGSKEGPHPARHDPAHTPGFLPTHDELGRGRHKRVLSQAVHVT